MPKGQFDLYSFRRIHLFIGPFKEVVDLTYAEVVVVPTGRVIPIL